MNEFKNWIGQYGEKSTKILYSSAVRKFLISTYGDKANIDLADTFISECRAGRDWFKDLSAFVTYLHESPPKTTNAYITAVKGFIENALDIEISKKQMKKLRGILPKGKRARTVDGDMNKERLRHILQHCDSKGTALFLLLESSGLRISEGLQLLLDDIDLRSDPVKVRVRGEIAKEGDPYYSFISREAKDALTEWLNVRDSYLQTAALRGRGLRKLGNGQGIKNVADKRLFPFSGYVAESMWVNAVRKAKLGGRDKSTNRYQFHIHMLRKFFQSQMKYAGVPEDLVEALVGHTGYLDDAYRRYNHEQIVEMYKKGEPQLLLNVSAEAQTLIKTEVDKQRQELADLTRKLTDSNNLFITYMAQNQQLEKRVASLEKAFNILAEMTPEQWRHVMQEGSRIQFERQKAEDKKQFEFE